MLLHHPALRGFFLQFHMADAPSEAEADIARIETVVVGRGMIGVEASRARGAAFEDVVGVEVKRQATVEQVGGQTAIHAPIRLVDHQHVLATTTIVGVDIYL